MTLFRRYLSYIFGMLETAVLWIDWRSDGGYQPIPTGHIKQVRYFTAVNQIVSFPFSTNPKIYTYVDTS